MKYEIIDKEILNPTVIRMRIHAPLVARKAEAGQFIILRTDEEGERIPLTIADFDRVRGTVTVIFQIVGATTKKLNALMEGDCLRDFVGPLGRATETDGIRKVADVGGVAHLVVLAVFLKGKAEADAGGTVVRCGEALDA